MSKQKAIIHQAWTIRDGKATDFREYMDTASSITAHRKP